MKPLLRTHAELEIIDQLPLFIEYRIYNYKLSKKGTGKLVYGYGYSSWDVLSLIGIYFLWNHSHVSFYLDDLTNYDLSNSAKVTLVEWTRHHNVLADKNDAIAMGCVFALGGSPD
jgi:hypothetical protein